ncbi:MAG: hypothetical protein JRG70_11585 [Deltaproteobacteria bacterium]|nr:hypothetical protein [Deltaproteobacteria bacterium]
MTDAICLGIFGWPVAHSKSPQMHESAARALGIELRYERFEVAPGDLADSIRRKHDAAIDGYNLTVPHKEAVMTLIDEVTPAAQAIGAVNTVVRTDGRYARSRKPGYRWAARAWLCLAPGAQRARQSLGSRTRGRRPSRCFPDGRSKVKG